MPENSTYSDPSAVKFLLPVFVGIQPTTQGHRCYLLLINHTHSYPCTQVLCVVPTAALILLQANDKSMPGCFPVALSSHSTSVPWTAFVSSNIIFLFFSSAVPSSKLYMQITGRKSEARHSRVIFVTSEPQGSLQTTQKLLFKMGCSEKQTLHSARCTLPGPQNRNVPDDNAGKEKKVSSS